LRGGGGIRYYARNFKFGMKVASNEGSRKIMLKTMVAMVTL